MDLVFKRYSSPFLFLNILIENNNFSSGIDELYHIKNEEKWWEMYLATLPLNEKSYDEWKKESLKGSDLSINKSEELSVEYVETAIKKSQDILSNFNPLK